MDKVAEEDKVEPQVLCVGPSTSPSIAVLIDKPRSYGKYANHAPNSLANLARLLGGDRISCYLHVVYCQDVKAIQGCVAVYVGGGSVFSLQKELGEAGMRSLSSFVHSGGGYLGICAGALLAGADGFDGSNPQHCLLGAKTGYCQGKGTCTASLSVYGRAVFRRKDLGEVAMRYSHGAWFSPSNSRANTLLGVENIPPAVPLAFFVRCKSDEGNEVLFGDWVPMVQGQFGRGRVIAIGPHPETSTDADARGLIHPAMEWVAKRGLTRKKHGGL